MLLNIDKMTIRQKLGMVYCARRFSEEDIEFVIELIKEHSLGCVQLPANRPETIKRILDVADYPILVFNDTEMGFPTSDLPKIPLVSLAACGKVEYYRAFAKGVVNDAKKAGFNGTWGPVIDVMGEDGPVRVHRKFSDNPQKVAEAAEIIADVYKDNAYISTGKHYPGGSEGPYDSHMTEPKCHDTLEELIEKSFVPYIHLWKKGLLPSIMVGHYVYPNIDPDYPASLSKKVIGIMRDMGYDGVFFTDSLAMMGTLQRFGEENVYGLAIAAGNDIILPNYRTPVKESFEQLVKNYENGLFSEDRLNDAVRHVLSLMDFVEKGPQNPTPFTEEDKELIYSVAKDCITAVTDDGLTAKLLGNNEDKLFVVMEAMESTGGGKGEIDVADWYNAEQIAKKIKKEFPGSGVEFIPEYSTQRDHDRVLTAATKYKEVIYITYCTTTSYLGTDCLTRRAESVINALLNSNKISTVVHFGNPFALKTLLHVPRKIFGYHIPESQIYAIDVLAGNIEAKGTLPFDIDFA